MRKVLTIATGIAILAGVQSAVADQIRQACVNIALQQCNALGPQCTSNGDSAKYLSLYNQCVSTETVKAAAAAKQKQQNAAAARNNVQPRPYHSK